MTPRWPERREGRSRASARSSARVVFTSRPPMVSVSAPDRVSTSASKGAVCSDSSSPASKAKSVMLPAAVRASTRLAMPSGRWCDEIIQREQFARRKGACHGVLCSGLSRALHAPQVSEQTDIQGQPAPLTAAAGHTTESSPPSQAFMVAVSSQS